MYKSIQSLLNGKVYEKVSFQKSLLLLSFAISARPIIVDLQNLITDLWLFMKIPVVGNIILTHLYIYIVMSSPRVSSSTTIPTDSQSASTVASTPTANPLDNSSHVFILDENKLSAAGNPEKQEIYLFNWLANAERELLRASKVG